MKKSDFNILDWDLKLLLENAEIIIKNRRCIDIDCFECPLDDICFNCELWEENNYQDRAVELAKQFIKLFGGSMTEQELYQKWQKEWVEFHNVEVGDVVKVVSSPKKGCFGWEYEHDADKDYMIGEEFTVEQFDHESFDINDGKGFPFFCLEYIGKPEEKVEITITVNGAKVDPSYFSLA